MQLSQRLRVVNPAIVLFLMAPLVSEFLLGNLPITMLQTLVVLAPMYGGGAVVIREVTRRTGRGWPTILLLGLAYGVLEEAFTTQTLFNPDYLHLNLHLLDHTYIPFLGIGAWWTLAVLTLHAVWSICVSIALVEGLYPNSSTTPWLGRIGMSVMTFVFLFGIAVTTLITLSMERERGGVFVASTPQFIGSGVVIVVLVVVAFMLPTHKVPTQGRPVYSPWIIGAISLLSGSVFLIVPPTWDWWAVALLLSVQISTIMFLKHQSSHRIGWTGIHRLAVASGFALAYAWHAFPQPSLGNADPKMDLVGNIVFASGVIWIIFLAARRTSQYNTTHQISPSQEQGVALEAAVPNDNNIPESSE